MPIDQLFRSIFNIETIHSFNFFLGTPAGELLKRFMELVFFSIILYMIISEFRRNDKREYKYLIIGFSALLIRQLFMSTILFINIFGVFKFTRFSIAVLFIDNYLESIALLLLAAAFIFPAFKKRTYQFQHGILYAFYIITGITLFEYIIFKYGILELDYVLLIIFFLKILILASPFIILWKNSHHNIRYFNSILLAFFIYLLIPLISFLSLLFYGRIDPRLIVMQHPLPFLSFLLLMRSVFLKLVDKAFLRTKLRKSEEDLAEVKELSKLKDHFISIVSHELRTPITSMKLYLALFNKNKFGKLSLKQKKAIKTIADENSRLADLIDNLLTINKIEANKIEIYKKEFNLRDIIDDLYINIAKSKNIKVVNKVKKKFIVKADKGTIKQVYINLMNNAIKFSQGRGTITISSGLKDKYWYLSVKDTGIGIKKQEIPKLFDKFYQVDNTHTRRNQGIGLGLAIVKHIVDLHKGTIEVNSEIGKGTEFRVLIPKE